VILEYIREAVALNEQGVKRPAVKKGPLTKLEIPKELLVALKHNPKARTTFDAFSPSCQREYIEWIAEAKRVETRQRRLVTALEWLSEGKPRNWKYMNCGTKKTPTKKS
jgi:uncharacterized protein YdeI (YjbR/CyaY-like superfamily)